MDTPKESPRLKKIREENAKFEKESPYNFCDRWCERCIHDKQMRCRLYLDEFEQKITCIAHGKEPDDPEMTAEVMKKQFEGIEETIEKHMEEEGFDIGDMNEEVQELVRKQEEFLENNPLDKTAEQYRKKVDAFLKDAFYKQGEAKTELSPDFETIAWYHTLLSVKLRRALCGFHEPVSEDEFALYDAVAQFEVCKKAIRESVDSLRKVNKHFPVRHIQILELIALLHNIHSRIEALEERI